MLKNLELKKLTQRFLKHLFYNVFFILVLLMCFSFLKENSKETPKIVPKTIIQEMQVDDKPEIPIQIHSGGEQLKHSELLKTIKIVISNINNLKDINHHDLCNLVLETLIVETLVGKSSYEYASKNYRNYGIAQIREDTARWLLDYLKKTDIKTYNDIIQYYYNDKSLKYNLLKNVPFSIAICAEYYYNRNKNLNNEIYSVNLRARQWKKFYNTYKGKGTQQIYKKRVDDYYALHIID